MLKLNNAKIVKAGGKIHKTKEKKQTKTTKPFCKTYITPPDVIEYYNNPNYCLNCNKTISAGNNIKYSNIKSKIFCHENCEKKFMKVTGLELTRRKTIASFFSALSACVQQDMVLMDYWIDEIKISLVEYANDLDDRDVDF
jgi:hypothetical protein